MLFNESPSVFPLLRSQNTGTKGTLSRDIGCLNIIGMERRENRKGNIGQGADSICWQNSAGYFVLCAVSIAGMKVYWGGNPFEKHPLYYSQFSVSWQR